MNWRRISLPRRAALTGLLALGAARAASLSGADRAVVVRHTAGLPGLTRPLRVAQLTDLHYGLYIGAEQVRAWVDATLTERPDLIVITGDFLDADVMGGAAPLLAELSRLSAPLGVYGVWGNHDYGSFGQYARRFHSPQRADWRERRAHFAAALADSGVTILTNAGVQLRPDVYLAGVDDWMQGQPDLTAALRGRGGGATLLLSHNPDQLPFVPASVGLTLCGHTHGGQVRLPLLGAVSTASAHGQRFAQGWVQAPARAFVSRGLGMTAVPARLSCPAEIAVFELEPVQAGFTAGPPPFR
ncbi:metallophosphoesterase [Deinococcus radiopugnans]|uniref:metallophosphoesterase n=1 Tax=Deinococcus radiopugnans TaxID=57497 RepID=UPI00068D34A2|nr:metallophosphoesterase [Deinococcus radiopugnans]